MKLYPLKFQPIFHYRIWGGNKLKSDLNKNYNESNVGESWEISSVKNSETKVLNGDLKGFTLEKLINTYKESFLGKHIFKQFGNEFPLLIKFIDAKDPLSIQGHPNNELAEKRHNSFGKNEMWYVMQADKESELIVGFNKELTKNEYINALEKGEVLNIMNSENVESGDTFYVPTGRVHAIGSGVLLAEIQQTSNITYRIYDYDRVDAVTGEKRELHTDMALDAIDFSLCENYKTNYTTTLNVSNKLVHSPYFKTNILNLDKNMAKDYSALDSFVIFICVEGSLELKYANKLYSLKKGETILLPAAINNVEIITSEAKILEVFL